MRKLQEMLAPTDMLLISDEVYEHMVYAPSQHLSAASYPAWRRAPSSCPALARPTTSPAGKWAPWPRRPAMTAEFRKVHQFNVFTVNTPMQHGLAAYMADPRPT
jgi:methionine aminotransferase